MTPNFSKIKSLLTLFLLALLPFNLLAGDIIVFLEATNNYNGSTLKPDFRVQSINSGNAYTLKEEDGRKYFELKDGDKVIIKAILDGFYPEEKSIAHSDFSGDEVIETFKMRARPVAKLVLSAIEPDRKRNNPAEFEVYLNKKLIGKGNTTKNNPTFSLVVTENGKYEIKVKSQDFAEKVDFQEVEVSTPMNEVTKIIELTKASTEILLTFIDEQFGKPIDAQVTITDKTSGKEVYNGKPGNGEMKFTFESDVLYQVLAEGAGIKTFTKDLQGPVKENQIFRVRPETTVEFKVFNVANQKPLKSKYKITAPSGKEILVNDRNTFNPEERGNYIVEVSSDGFMSKTGTVIVNSLSGGVTNFTFNLEEADQLYRIKIIDHYSKEVLQNVDFKVFTQAGVSLSGLKPDKSWSWDFATDSEGKYFVEASAEGYSDYTKNLKDNEKKFEVELFWKPELTYALFLKDELTKELVENAELKILDSKGKNVFVYKTNETGKYLARLYKNENYSFMINSKDYEENLSSVTNENNNVQILYLKKKGTKDFTITFKDFATNEPLKPEFMIGQNGKPMTVKGNLVSLESGGVYKLTAIQNGYNQLQLEDILKEAKESLIELRLKKSSYPVHVMIENLNTANDHSDVTVLLDSKSGALKSRFDSKSLWHETFLNADDEYNLGIRKEGYENYKLAFKLKDLKYEGVNGFVLKAKLIEIPKKEEVIARGVKAPIIKEEKKPEPPKEIPKPKVEEPKPTPVQPVISEAVKDILAKIPSDKRGLVDEMTSKNSVGKRYFLDQVNFNQGSPVITEKTVEQLNLIAEVLKEHPGVKIEIVGHTDNVGDPRANQGLSKFRAKAVGNYLFNHGADPNRIIVVGKGQDEPIAPNDTEENKSKNRRVEMILVSN